MKHFMKKAIAVVLMLALFCGMVPAAFAADAGYYTISLDACGGVVDIMELSTNKNGKLTSLPVPTMEGYTFDGWYTELVAGEKVTSSTQFDADSTIYAYWVSNDVAAKPAQPTKGGIKSYIGTFVIAGITVFSLTMLVLAGSSGGVAAQ